MIILCPWGRKTSDGKQSPKNYPFWSEVVKAFPNRIHQISCHDEPDVPGCKLRSNDLLFSKIETLLKECETWVSIDTYVHHLGWSIGKRGVVIFGPSDPEIFGHPENINLLKDRKYIRTRQFGMWSEEVHNPEAFVHPALVVNAIMKLCKPSTV